MNKEDKSAEGRQHVALPLKYRPMTFDDVVGQEHVVRTLKHAIESGRIANAYLFVGPRGIGKTTTSRIFAKALNCLSPNGAEPCGKCENCTQIAEGRSLDVMVQITEQVFDILPFGMPVCGAEVFYNGKVHRLFNPFDLAFHQIEHGTDNGNVGAVKISNGRETADTSLVNQIHHKSFYRIVPMMSQRHLIAACRFRSVV